MEKIKLCLTESDLGVRVLLKGWLPHFCLDRQTYEITILAFLQCHLVRNWPQQ